MINWSYNIIILQENKAIDHINWLRDDKNPKWQVMS